MKQNEIINLTNRDMPKILDRITSLVLSERKKEAMEELKELRLKVNKLSEELRNM